MLSLAAIPAAQSALVAHFPMDVTGGCIRETVSGEEYAVQGNFAPENLPGAVGMALRFDGYTSHVEAALGDIFPQGTDCMTVSAWIATPSYPIIQIDTETSEMAPVVSCLDTEAKTGFGFYLGFDGRYSFRTYIGGWPVNVDVAVPLPTYEWNHLVAVIDGDSRTVRLFNNGVEVGSGRANGSLSFAPGPLFMGQGRESRMSGPFELISFNGLIDDVSIWDEALTGDDILAMQPDNAPDLDIPASRFADDMLRPRFHGMPAAGWTNECHGMYHSDGRYHLFFQKNADGPYMARLHWGHISSENLYDWREERIALAPGAPYDIKGCWSGCVFADDEITGGAPNILYTAVDYAKASVAQASPATDRLDVWTKYAGNPVIAGRPAGLSDDFRDPYFFRSGDDAYVIVGTSKDGVGATTLHRYSAASGMWSNNGDIFFAGSSASMDGRFWEMPTVTPMGDGRWLFTATPLETMQGVRTLYWVGTIDGEGRFVPDAGSGVPRLVEMESREGFGLLSPTVYQHDGKTIALGIVPDKLSSLSNWNLGWAHCYSLPREWSLDAGGTLIQKPFAGLAGMRTATSYARREFELEGEVDLTPVSGRSAEILGRFVVGQSPFGFTVFGNGSSRGTVTYDSATGELTADFSALPRLVNDGGVYDGVYRCRLPERPAAGSELKIDMFVDHSILDIFVNDRWATSIRVFPTESGPDTIGAFSSGPTHVTELQAWVLSPESGSGVSAIPADGGVRGTDCVYDLSGRPVGNPEGGISSGIYVIGGSKVMVR